MSRNLIEEVRTAREASAYNENAPDVALLFLAHARNALEQAKREIADLEVLISSREQYLAEKAKAKEPAQ